MKSMKVKPIGKHANSKGSSYAGKGGLSSPAYNLVKRRARTSRKAVGMRI